MTEPDRSTEGAANDAGTTSIRDYYTQLRASRQTIFEECFSDRELSTKHVVSHSLLNDLIVLDGTIEGPEKQIFSLGCRELQHSFESVIYGRYRHAFHSLRLSFELLLASIHFSANYLRMNLWLKEHEDLRWSTIVDIDNGVFSINFFRAFFPDISDLRSQYQNLATTVYRECSEYVHGNPHTHEDIQRQASIDRESFVKFHDHVSTVVLCVMFAFFMRYGRTLSSESINRLENLAQSNYSHVTPIMDLFEKAPE